MDKENRIAHKISTSKLSFVTVADFLMSTEAKSQSYTTVLNICNTAIGAGILALPYVFKQFGIILGLILLVVVYFMANKTCQILLKVKNYTGLKDYSQVGHFAFQDVGDVVIKCIIILHNLGMSITYFIVYAAAITNLLKGYYDNHNLPDSFICTRYFAVLCLAIVEFPFIFAKSLQKMKFVSFISAFGIFFFTFSTLYTVIKKKNNGSLAKGINWLPPPWDQFDYKSAMSCFTTIFLAFTFHYNFYPIYRSLANRSGKKMMRNTIIALTSILTVYILVSVCGYLSYGNGVDHDYLDTAKRSDVGSVMFTIEYLAFAAIGATAVPLQYFECRNNMVGLYRIINKAIAKRRKTSTFKERINSLLLQDDQNENESSGIEKIKKQSINFNSNNSENDASPLSQEHNNAEGIQQFPKGEKKLEVEMVNRTFFISFSITLYVVIAVLGAVLTNLSFMFAIIGSLCSNSIAFLIPCCFYIKLAHKRSFTYKISWAMLIFGILAAIVSITGVILTM